MKLRKGQIHDIFLDYKEQRKFVGKAVLLSKNKKSVLPALSFFSDTENDIIDNVNRHLVTIPLIKGESNGIEYRVKPIPLKYIMYSFEYWLVEFIDGKHYPVGFRKNMKVRIEIGKYNTLLEASNLTINDRSVNIIEEVYNERD